MYKEILTTSQIELLPLIKDFSPDYYLVGGTAIALYLGHRRSIDFDLFTNDRIKKLSIKRKLDLAGRSIDNMLFEDSEQLHVVINTVKITFFSFPYPVIAKTNFDGIINMPDLLTLSAMKAFALGGRAKWKDYVDLYFLLKDKFSLCQIADQAKTIFGSFFNEKLLREQLCYFQDIDYSESIDFVSTIVSDDDIQDYLSHIATAPM